MTQTIARRCLVAGRVQGVAFRHFTKLRARELGLVGWVQNLADGRVEAWLEGAPRPVGELVAWLRRGPPAAHVERLEVIDEPPQGHARFEVRR